MGGVGGSGRLLLSFFSWTGMLGIGSSRDELMTSELLCLIPSFPGFVLACSGFMTPMFGAALKTLLKLVSLLSSSNWKYLFSSYEGKTKCDINP